MLKCGTNLCHSSEIQYCFLFIIWTWGRGNFRGSCLKFPCNSSACPIESMLLIVKCIHSDYICGIEEKTTRQIHGVYGHRPGLKLQLLYNPHVELSKERESPFSLKWTCPLGNGHVSWKTGKIKCLFFFWSYKFLPMGTGHLHQMELM